MSTLSLGTVGLMAAVGAGATFSLAMTGAGVRGLYQLVSRDPSIILITIVCIGSLFSTYFFGLIGLSIGRAVWLGGSVPPFSNSLILAGGGLLLSMSILIFMDIKWDRPSPIL